MNKIPDTFIFKKTNSFEIRGDFYAIDSLKKPLLIYIHGGGLIWGSRKDIIEQHITQYQKAGYHVCSIDYRLAPETKLADIALDIQDALKWMKTEGKNIYPFDPERIAMIGSSAGAYLALLAGSFSIKPQAIISFYGYGDILANWYTQPAAHFTAMTTVPPLLAEKLIQKRPITEGSIKTRYAIYLHYRQAGIWVDHITGLNRILDRERILSFCPIHLVDDSYPPTLLLHGTKDKDVPYEESVKMSEALTKYNVNNRLITVPDGEHLFDHDIEDPATIKAMEDVLTFLNKNL